MVCTDRQLEQAAREAAFQQNRNAGALKAIRPFTGPATPENLVDYLNREVYPVLRQARSAVNEIFRQVTDNAPSGNPLGYFFSASLAGDPAVGRLSLDNATQENATTIRVNQQNSILRDITPWLDVMAGSSTAPLGVVTLTAAADPSRYIRWDLNTMTDQGVYWDLGVTVVESSHPNPFVPDGSVVLAFIPGVASTGTTVGPGSITPIADETFLGNVSGVVAPPSAIALSTLAGTGLTWDAAGNNFDVTAPFVPQGWDDVLAVDATSGANNPIVSAGQFMQLGAVGPATLGAQLRSGDASFIMHGSSQARLVGGTTVAINAQGGSLSATASTSVSILGTTTASIATVTSEVTVAPATFFRLTTGGSERLEIEATGGWQLGGLVGTAGQYIRSAGAGASPAWATISVGELGTIAAETFLGNFTAGVAAPAAVAGSTVAGAGLTYTTGGILAVGAGTNVTVNANDVAVTNFPLTGLATQAANTIVANATGGVAAPTAVAVAADSVLARVGGNLVSHPWATLAGTFLSYSAGVMDWIGLDVRANSGALTGTRTRLNVIGTSPVTVAAADDGVGNEVDVTISVSAIPLTSLATQADDTFLANISGGVATPTAVALTTLAGAGLTGGADAILAVGAGTRITVNANDVQLATGAAESFLMNATAGVATADYRAGSSVAGAGLTYTAGGTLAVGAGTNITVNADDVAVNLSSLVPAIDSASVVANGTVLERAAFTGEVTSAQNSNATVVDRSTNFTWTGVHSFTGTSNTVNVSAAANTTAGSSSTIQTSSGNLTVSSSAAILTLSAGDDVVVTATDDIITTAGVSGNFRITTNGVERLRVNSNGSIELAGDTGTAGEVLTSAGSAAPPTWDVAPRLLQVSSAFAADASITITPPSGCTWFEFELVGGGGGGGGADADTNLEVCAGSGGGGGECVRGIVAIVSGNITGSIGGGGAGGNTSGTNGANGVASVLTYNAVSYTADFGELGIGTAAGPVGGSIMRITPGGLGGYSAIAGATGIRYLAGQTGGYAIMYAGPALTQSSANGGLGGSPGGGGHLSDGAGNISGGAGGSNGSGSSESPGAGGAGGAAMATGARVGNSGGAGTPGCMVVRFYSGAAPTLSAIT